jgi:hypothetical protein
VLAVPTAVPTPPPTPPPGVIERAIAMAEAEARLRLSFPRDLPGDARIMRVAIVNQTPPTLDVEYLIGSETVLLRQRPAQSNPQFPPEAKPIDIDGIAAQGVARVDASGRQVGVELYWSRDGMDYLLGGNLPAPEMARIARSVARPGSA